MYLGQPRDTVHVLIQTNPCRSLEVLFYTSAGYFLVLIYLSEVWWKDGSSLI